MVEYLARISRLVQVGKVQLGRFKFSFQACELLNAGTWFSGVSFVFFTVKSRRLGLKIWIQPTA